MGNKIALIIIFNHRYDKNIPVLEKLYKDKFSYVFFVVPFYDGQKENVIAVYESSFYFEGYIAQAYQHLKNKGFSHYYFIADDMIINPTINENNFFEQTGINENECWINGFEDIKTRKYHHRVQLYIPTNKNGIEVAKIFPDVKEVELSFKKFNLSYYPSKWYALKYLIKNLRPHRHCPNAWIHALSYIFKIDFKELRRLDSVYPGVWGYSDTLVIPSQYMQKFAQYCGAFSGLKVFVENAVPLALLMTTTDIQTKVNIKLKTVPQIYAENDNFEKDFNSKYQFSLNKLMQDFPKDIFFIHPLKLSKWK